MRKRFYLGVAFSLLSAMIFVACGGGGSPSGGSEPTLGITSIEKMGATAIPNPKLASNAGQIGAFLNKIDRLFGKKIAYALVPECSASAPTSFEIKGGEVWLEEVYVIFDQVQFNQSSSSGTMPDKVDVGPFGLDLLNNDPLVDESFSIDVPPGQYTSVRFRVKRVDDTQPAGTRVPPSLIAKILGSDNSKRRPSVWIKGQIGVDNGSGFFDCTSFTFVTDRRWEETIQFKEFPGSIKDDAVLSLDIEKTFQVALSLTGSDAAGLKVEVGKLIGNIPDIQQLGPGFLDGRVKDPNHGTPIALVIADQLPFHMKVFIQGVGDFSVPDGTTLIDDSASLVSDGTLPDVGPISDP